MNRSLFADALRQAILAAIDEFRQQYPSETPYGFALVGDPGGAYLGYAIPTEEGLRRVAEEYERLGFRYKAFRRQKVNNCEKLRIWVRWANPDDGWIYGDFPERFGIQAALHQLVESGELGENADGFEEFCTEILASLQDLPGWGERSVPTSGPPIVVGFTWGEDPRDFLRTATRANPYHLVRRLWFETWQADEIDSRIKFPK